MKYQKDFQWRVGWRKQERCDGWLLGEAKLLSRRKSKASFKGLTNIWKALSSTLPWPDSDDFDHSWHAASSAQSMRIFPSCNELITVELAIKVLEPEWGKGTLKAYSHSEFCFHCINQKQQVESCSYKLLPFSPSTALQHRVLGLPLLSFSVHGK